MCPVRGIVVRLQLREAYSEVLSHWIGPPIGRIQLCSSHLNYEALTYKIGEFIGLRIRRMAQLKRIDSGAVWYI